MDQKIELFVAHAEIQSVSNRLGKIELRFSLRLQNRTFLSGEYLVSEY